MIYQEESPEYKTMSAGFHEEFAPATPEERYLVNVLVHSAWQQRQCFRIENAFWEAEAKNATYASLLRVFKDLEPLSRLDESASKRFHSVLGRLMSIRTERARNAAKAAKLMGPPKSSGLFQVPKPRSFKPAC